MSALLRDPGDPQPDTPARPRRIGVADTDLRAATTVLRDPLGAGEDSPLWLETTIARTFWAAHAIYDRATASVPHTWSGEQETVQRVACPAGPRPVLIQASVGTVQPAGSDRPAGLRRRRTGLRLRHGRR